jgi:hypothetical protein
MAAYALTAFIGAFLLFQVQPLMGKYLLPWFGGGPGVWTTCLLFFQVSLLGGYAYAHWSVRRLKPRNQAIVHAVLLLAALLWLFMIPPGDFWKPQGGGNPTLQILLLLTLCVGVPYLVLSATGPLVQQWFSRDNPGCSPYRLYALSNVGSLLALISYPFYFETHFTRKVQAFIWAAGVVVYVVCCGFCVVRIWRSSRGSSVEAGSSFDSHSQILHVESPSMLLKALWLLLPGCASALLMAITNKMCQDVAVIPFLWVLPLALYLLSFIICFDSPRWYMRLPFTLALIAASAGICWALFRGVDLPIRKQVVIYSGALFLCCMVCHGELYRLRPNPRFLTGYYLMIATGGALGGIFVAVAAPLLFTDYFELHWSLMLCGLLLLGICVINPRRPEDADQRSHNDDSTPQHPANVDGVLHHPITSRRTSFAERFVVAMNDWRWLACGLTLAVFAGFDRFFAWMTPGMKTAAAMRYPGLSAAVRRAADYIDGFLVRAGAHPGIADSQAVARTAMWGALLALGIGWVISGRFKRFQFWRLITCVWLSLLLMVLGAVLVKQANHADGLVVSRSRSFYGVLSVLEYEKADPKSHYYLLQHGRITHGIQFTDPEQAKWPTSYYGEESGIGMAFQLLPNGPRHIGVVGLGTGSISVYGRQGDRLRIYDINPNVERLANSRFTYLRNCRERADVQVVLGDARLSLEREPPQHFDLIALDAFSSDSIPVHLLTRESFQVYGRHLNTNGIIAVHISNHYLDLEPVVRNLARHFNYSVAVVDYDETDSEWWLYGSTWMLLSQNASVLQAPAILDANEVHATTAGATLTHVPLWTDDFTSLFQILK